LLVAPAAATAAALVPRAIGGTSTALPSVAIVDWIASISIPIPNSFLVFKSRVMVVTGVTIIVISASILVVIGIIIVVLVADLAVPRTELVPIGIIIVIAIAIAAAVIAIIRTAVLFLGLRNGSTVVIGAGTGSLNVRISVRRSSRCGGT
jgi:hypothetical protein